MVDRRDRGPGGGRGSPAGEGGRDPRHLVRPDRRDYARLGQDPDLEGAVGDQAPGVGDAVSDRAQVHVFEAYSPPAAAYSPLIWATAIAAIPSPRPTQPIPSLLVAFTLTRAEMASERIRSISGLYGPRRGSSQTTVTSTFTTRPRRPPITVRSRSIESASRQRSSSSGNMLPMSPLPAAPSRASITACVRTSASEWPARPRSCSTSTPPRTRRRPSAKRWLSYPIPTLIGSILADRGAERLQAPG